MKTHIPAKAHAGVLALLIASHPCLAHGARPFNPNAGSLGRMVPGNLGGLKGVAPIGALSVPLGETPVPSGQSEFLGSTLVDAQQLPLEVAVVEMRIPMASPASEVLELMAISRDADAGNSRGETQRVGLSVPGQEGAAEQGLNTLVASAAGINTAGSTVEAAELARLGFEGPQSPSRGGVVVTTERLTENQLFSPVRNIARPSAERVRQLAQASDEVARLRAIRAAKAAGLPGADQLPQLSAEEEAVLRGIDDFATAAAIADTDPAGLASDMAVLRDMNRTLKRRIAALADEFLRTNRKSRSTPGAVPANLRHIYLQHVGRSRQDIPQLFELFGKSWGYQNADAFAEDLHLLMKIHDLGKVEIPPDMKAALGRFVQKGRPFYVEMYILGHKYASFHWIQDLGAQAGAAPREILALQRLIANHDFGPDLSDPRNKGLLSHWWPTAFANQMMPILAAMGVNPRHFPVDAAGRRNYGHTARSGLGSVLSTYDRMIDLDSLWKYSNQDWNTWKLDLADARAENAARMKRNAERGSGELKESLLEQPETNFRGSLLIRNMRASARWAQDQLLAEWLAKFETPEYQAQLKALGYGTWDSFLEYPPFKGALQDNHRLLDIIAKVEADNRSTPTGVAYYRDDRDVLYRVVMEDPANPDSPAKVYTGNSKKGQDIQDISRQLGWGASTPVKFFFDMLQKYNPGLQVPIPDVINLD